MNTIKLGPVIRLAQSSEMPVAIFQATAAQILSIARVERADRRQDGRLVGFQRPQIQAHIHEIQDYLNEDEAPILPNAIVIGFCGGASIKKDMLVVDTADAPPGWVVDGQQRLTAATRAQNQNFPLLVSAFLCRSVAELHKQFILINSTRPLPRDLIYELMPGVEGLPPRLSDRTAAALLVEALNYRDGSPLKGMIKQHTNRAGVIKDTIIQRVLMASLSDGALSAWRDDTSQLLGPGYAMVANFFAAVKECFADDWEGQTPKTSRLVHGVGLVAMGYVMDALAFDRDARSKDDFVAGLQPLVGRTAFRGGEWQFTDQRRLWHTLQNTGADYQLLATHLVSLVRRPRGLRLVGDPES
ncbi:DGQHR domain-containing protein DpdB [Sphingomonas sp. Leaf231]|uniref:DGQHR domain-containing protein DpdB n=1 Tax=Sphingomonas sp. Leaf231 TaxID=1736301 RepID=UPI0009EA6CC1|nr:DGQHR domain-containing protein DpdB [Sphingomonas sp. Leaf231]